MPFLLSADEIGAQRADIGGLIAGQQHDDRMPTPLQSI
jgi:hypothetical protein